MKRILPIFLLFPLPAFAHTGLEGGQSFFSGLSHPVGGLDHLLAMVAVGLCASVIGGQALRALPLAFLGGMLAGGFAGAMGAPLPGVEPMILASIMVLGVVTALALRPGLPALVAMTAAFGLFHGHAHGAEGPEAGFALYAGGFVIATALLHVAGLGIGTLVKSTATRIAGGLTALAGLVLALS